jgi:hypothetical protein
MTELNDNRPPEVFTRKWLLIVIVCSLPIFFLFAFLGDPAKGRTAGISAAVGMTAIRGCWNLRKHVSFWTIVAALIALHMFLIWRVPWNDKSYPGYTLLPFAVLDYGVVYGIFKLAEKVMKRGDEPSSPV